jgi:hypothetical protein
MLLQLLQAGKRGGADRVLPLIMQELLQLTSGHKGITNLAWFENATRQ